MNPKRYNLAALALVYISHVFSGSNLVQVVFLISNVTYLVMQTTLHFIFHLSFLLVLCATATVYVFWLYQFPFWGAGVSQSINQFICQSMNQTINFDSKYNTRQDIKDDLAFQLLVQLLAPSVSTLKFTY